MGGIEVINVEVTGVKIPVSMAIAGDKSMPAKKTGICMGRNTFPPRLKVWKIVGTIRPPAIRSPASTSSFVFFNLNLF